MESAEKYVERCVGLSTANENGNLQLAYRIASGLSFSLPTGSVSRFLLNILI